MVACCASGAFLVGLASAHPVYMDHIEHHVQISIDPANIDVTVELRFNELRSLSERRKMDTDRDGLIGPAERARYLRRIRREVADAFSLTCGGRPLELVELYEPKLNLLGVEGVSPSHHSLELYYFARTPADLTGAVRLEFEDRSWPSAPALWFPTATGAPELSVRAAAAASSQPANEAEAEPRRRITIHVGRRAEPATRPAPPEEMKTL